MIEETNQIYLNSNKTYVYVLIGIIILLIIVIYYDIKNDMTITHIYVLKELHYEYALERPNYLIVVFKDLTHRTIKTNEDLKEIIHQIGYQPINTRIEDIKNQRQLISSIKTCIKKQNKMIKEIDSIFKTEYPGFIGIYRIESNNLILLRYSDIINNVQDKNKERTIMAIKIPISDLNENISDEDVLYTSKKPFELPGIKELIEKIFENDKEKLKCTVYIEKQDLDNIKVTTNAKHIDTWLNSNHKGLIKKADINADTFNMLQAIFATTKIEKIAIIKFNDLKSY